MGRPKLWHETMLLKMPQGAKGRIDAVLRDGEDRSDFLREALEKEVTLREKTLAKGRKATAN
ncbi:hypothetical protein ACLNGM_10165 [Aureimonas phyllosphaerae]|uniref:hypothetical protein n=1 Tax=Aureimonas phyllosphaerae TaxID=1166078 RepID=UPI003A5C03FB